MIAQNQTMPFSENFHTRSELDLWRQLHTPPLFRPLVKLDLAVGIRQRLRGPSPVVVLPGLTFQLKSAILDSSFTPTLRGSKCSIFTGERWFC